MANEVEPRLWRKACAAVKRYFRNLEAPRSKMATAIRAAIEANYRTGWIMGYRTGVKSASKLDAKP
jgi:hypothetical protein